MLISGPSTSSGTDIDSTPKHRLVDSPISRLVNQITKSPTKYDTPRKRPKIRRPNR